MLHGAPSMISFKPPLNSLVLYVAMCLLPLLSAPNRFEPKVYMRNPGAYLFTAVTFLLFYVLSVILEISDPLSVTREATFCHGGLGWFRRPLGRPASWSNVVCQHE